MYNTLGSGEGHTAYIYRRLSSSDIDAAAAAVNRKVSKLSNQKSLKIPDLSSRRR